MGTCTYSGYSFVYLVQDVATGRHYALKKIRCAPGDQEAVADAMREIDMYRMFQHENIIKVLVSNIGNIMFVMLYEMANDAIGRLQAYAWKKMGERQSISFSHTIK